MTTFIQARLKEIAKEAGGNRALCHKSGISERTFANWLSGSSEPKIIGLSAIATAASVTIDWLVTGTPPKARLGSHADTSQNTIMIAWLDNQLANSELAISQRLKINDHFPFSKTFLENRLGQSNFDNLCVLEITGDSMLPTMGDGDLVLIDRDQNQMQDGLMAFIFKETICIKRIVNILAGVEVISDNKSLYPAHRIQGEDMTNLEPIGRIIWVCKNVL